MFCIENHTRNFWHIMGCACSGYKYAFNGASWFVSVIINFNVFYNAHTVKRHYTVPLKSVPLFCFLFDTILTVSNKIEEHLWLDFVYIFFYVIYKIYKDIYS